MTQVADHLWMCGDYEVGADIAKSSAELVVSCIAHGSWEPANLKDVPLHVYFPFDDMSYIPDQWRLDRVVKLIVAHIRDGKNVVVHCNAGLNRSGLLCALALRKLGMSATSAIATLRITRDKYALCNQVFENFVLDCEM